MGRYRLYREHKFVSFMLSDFSRAIGKSDFTSNESVAEIQEKFAGIIGLMNGHAEHENKSIHLLLKQKNSSLFEKIEVDHAGHAGVFDALTQIINEILASTDADERIVLGHQFYLGVQRFEGENLLHQFYEESVIMPELQRLYTDEELLAGVEAKTYQVMTPDQMVHMMQVLFPHFNTADREAFLSDILNSQPDKFLEAWSGIAPSIAPEEQTRLMASLGVQVDSTQTAASSSTQKLFYSWEKMPTDGSGERVKTTYDLERERQTTTVSDKPDALWAQKSDSEKSSENVRSTSPAVTS